MKNLFGYFSKAEDKRRDRFILREINEENKKQIEELRDETVEFDKKKKTPFWVQLLVYIMAGAGIIIVGSFIKNADNFSQLMEHVGYLFYIGIVLILAAVGLTVLVYFRNKNLDKDPEVERFANKIINKVEEVKEELDVPSTAIKVDIIASKVKIDKNGTEKVVKIGNFFGNNIENDLFVEKSNLCIADVEMVVGIPLDSIIGFELVNKKIILPSWNKEEHPKSENFKEYVKISQYGLLVKNYYQLIFQVDDEKYYIVIPNYDYDRVKKLLDENK